MRGLAIAAAGMLLAGPAYADCRGLDFKGVWTLDIDYNGCPSNSCNLICNITFDNTKIKQLSCTQATGYKDYDHISVVSIKGKISIRPECIVTGSIDISREYPNVILVETVAVEARMDFSETAFHGTVSRKKLPTPPFTSYTGRIAGYRQAR